MKNPIDRANDEARRRYADFLASAGVDSARFALEILYLLPSEFVRMYSELFEMALDDKPTSPGPMGKDGGRVKKKARREGVGAREIQPKGKNTRTVGGHFVVKSEEAMKQKTSVDRKIVRAVERALAELRTRRGAIRAADVSVQTVPDDTRGVRSDGVETDGTSGEAVTGGKMVFKVKEEMERLKNRQCAQCGMFQGPSWVRCPFHAD